MVADRRDFAREQEQLKLKIRQFHERAAKQHVRGIRIRSSARSRRKPGAVECTSTLITICGSSARKPARRVQALVACYPATSYFVATTIHLDA